MNSCGWCGGTELEPGFLEDRGQASQGFVSWVRGALERGPFGGAKRAGKVRLVVDANRCLQCGHLEFFANEPN